VSDQGLRVGSLAELQLERDLRRALPRGELSVHYQPVFQLTPRRLVGFEALLRWQHPRRGLLPAGEFLRAAESLGLLAPMGDWLLRTACRQMRHWQQSRPAAAELSLGVNLSAQQLLEPDYVGRVRGALAESGLAPGCLRLETAERLLAETSPRLHGALDGLRRLGVALDVDDFGTAGAGDGVVGRGRFDGLKLERSLVAASGDGVGSTSVLRTLLALARSLRVPVVAKGVETDQQLAQLRAIGCEQGQGQLFGKPVEAAGAERLLAAQATGIAHAGSQRERPALIGPQAS